MANENPYERLYPRPTSGGNDDALFHDDPDTAPVPMRIRSDAVDTSSPPPFVLPPGTPQYHAPAPKPKKPRQPFSPIPLLLIAGVAFLFLGGIVFLTSTWDVMPNVARAVSLLSAGVIAFGANLLAERIWKLPKTGLAFYILGCIFLPLAIAGIGVFRLLGDWYSFAGGGAYIVVMTLFLCAAVCAWFGARSYKSSFLAWIAMTGIAGGWSSFALFLAEQMPGGTEGRPGTCLIMGVWLLGGIAATVLVEMYLRAGKETPFSKAAVAFLLPLLLFYAAAFLTLAETCGVVGALLSLVLAALFINERFVFGKVHVGAAGALVALEAAAYAVMNVAPLDDAEFFAHAYFQMVVPGLILMTALAVPQASEVLRRSFGWTGAILSGLMLPIATIGLLFDEDHYQAILLGGGTTAAALLCFFLLPKGKLSGESGRLALTAPLLFVAALFGAYGPSEDTLVFALLLVIAALVLLVMFFLQRRPWTLVLALVSCGATLLLRLHDPVMPIFWLAAGTLLLVTVFGHILHRALVEKTAAIGFIAMLLPALQETLAPYLKAAPCWVLLMAAVTLLYLLETAFLRGHVRTEATRSYLEIVSLPLGLVTTLVYLFDDPSIWGILLMLLLLIFSAAFTVKKVNIPAFLPLAMLFFAFSMTMDYFEGKTLIQVGCYAGMLLLLAVMGRILLPRFVTIEDGVAQLDAPLATGVLTVFGAVSAIDWYPRILICVFLALYSLLYLGRVKRHYIPAFLASFFGCTAVLFHDIDDPFGILEVFRRSDMITPQILLYLLPVHLFIFTLLFILPKTQRRRVHAARFIAYCVTMLCLLVSSFRFGNVADAIVLVVFSFGILVGSFFVRRLRWFTLGFAVLVVMTIRLTWSFWTSLHWGIYLFLAGILLIGIASFFEYKNRRRAEHPEEAAAEKKPALFKDWQW